MESGLEIKPGRERPDRPAAAAEDEVEAQVPVGL
jgi:hypothetical protein